MILETPEVLVWRKTFASPDISSKEAGRCLGGEYACLLSIISSNISANVH